MKLPILAALAAGLFVVGCKADNDSTPAPVVVVGSDQPTLPHDTPPDFDRIDRDAPAIIRSDEGKRGFFDGLQCMNETNDAESCTVECTKNQDSAAIAGCVKAVEYMADQDAFFAIGND